MGEGPELAVRLLGLVDERFVELPAPPGATSMHAAMEELPDGVYSGLRTFGHRFLALPAHITRARRSMELLGWRADLDEDVLARALQEAVDAWPGDARVRFDALERPFALRGVDSRVFAALAPALEVPSELLRLGVHVPVEQRLTRELPLVKTTAFVRARKPHPRELREDYDRVMLDAEGRMLECTSANLFGVRDGALVTTPTGVLEGVTRGLLLRLARERGIPVVHERIPAARAGELDEAFLSSATRGVVPVVKLAGATVGSGSPGPRTLELSAAYEELARREACRVG